MYQFSRLARLTGSQAVSAMNWATEITEHVKSVTGLSVSLFTEVFSAAPGTLAWSTIVPDLATLEAAFDKLTPDPRYNELAEAGQAYTLPGSLSDRLRTIVHPAEPPANPTQPEYVTCVYATIANGNFARGIAAGVEIAQRVERITGDLTIFAMDSTGNYGGVAWLTGSASISQMQQAEEQINGDPSFVDYIDKEASAAFVEGATTQRILRRVI
ncbi:MAG TPA: hypothetical protein VFZ97_19950 [Acidimicrobiales bacterium]